MINEGKASSSMLIRTKFSPPRLARPPVRRERPLLSMIAGACRALTLLIAPAGFGKTTVLTMWREDALKQDHIVAWLTLDLDDNDENRFIDYLAASLADKFREEGLHSPEFANIGHLARIATVQTQVISIINAVDKIDREITLILDDYDKINSEAVHQLIQFLLSHIPANLHLVMASRTEPPIPLSSLRASDQLVELNTEVLRFGFDETKAFFSDSVEVDLSPNEASALHEATEGWVAGLQIATLALPGGELTGLPCDIHHNSRALSDYLVENVLTLIPDDIVHFMLQTSVLNRLNASLCEKLTGVNNAREQLEWLVRHNLFLQPLDDAGEWFRYHGLFAEFLQSLLAKRMSSDIQTLHECAADWFSKQQLWAEAVHHALMSKQEDQAAEWLERCALDELKNSRVKNFIGWTSKLPVAAIRKRPTLQITIIWGLILTLQLKEARKLVSEVEAQLQEESHSDITGMKLILQSQCISIMSMEDRIEQALQLGKTVWSKRFPNNQRPEEGFDWEDEAYLNVMLHLYRKVGDLASARAVSDFYLPSPNVTKNLFMQSYRACLYATLEVQEKHMQSAAHGLEQVIRVSEQSTGRRSAASTLPAVTLAGIYYEWNRLESVENLLVGRFDVIDAVCFIEPVQTAYLSLARVKIAQGLFDSAHELLNKAESIAENRKWLRLEIICISERARLWLRENRESDAQRAVIKLEALVERFCIEEPSAADMINLQYMLRARLLLYQKKYAETIALLTNTVACKEEALGASTPYEVAQLRILLAIAYHSHGDFSAFTDCFRCVIDLAEGDDMVRLLIDEGEVIIPLLKVMLHDDGSIKSVSYIKDLLALLETDVNKETQHCEQNSTSLTGETAGEFSRREREILELITEQLSNKEIARELYIAPETVKWHLKNIYKKLGVSDRHLASKRASEMLQRVPSGFVQRE